MEPSSFANSHPVIDYAMPPTSRVDVDQPDVGEGPSSGAFVAVTKREDTAPASRGSGLPSVLRFPIVAILSFSISSMGYSFINEFTKGELATIVRTLETPRELAIMTVWRLTELALGWIANFDSVDLAALNFLSHSPVVSNRPFPPVVPKSRYIQKLMCDWNSSTS